MTNDNKQCKGFIVVPADVKRGRPAYKRRCRRWVPGGNAYCCKHNETAKPDLQGGV